MVIGEAPGREETKLKTPFVGKAGRFLVGILREVFGLPREKFYITN
ncbi:MAG: uracil-DNA glycosylase, partial [Deltaproteobacteria bacterium]|nr:uracil-DNA glycosylase [Deltaproteobacteria bacterium]